MATKERILLVASDKGLTKAAFLKKAKLQRCMLDADKMGQAVSDRQLVAIHEAFPEVSMEWLLTGDGQMYKPTVVLPPDVVSLDRYTQVVRENERLRLAMEKTAK